MRYDLRITKHQFQKIPLLLCYLETDYLQEEINRPNGLPLWQIIYCVSGSGEFFFDGQRSLLRSGQIALIAPFENHHYQGIESDWIVHYLGFKGKACRELLASIRFEQSRIFHLAHPKQFLSHIQSLECVLSDEQPQKSPRCSKELYGMLVDLSLDVTKVPLAQHSEGSGLSDEIVHYLEEHFGEEVTLESLSDYFHLTPEYLCEQFKAETQQTIMNCLKNIRIHQAKIRLLEMPDAKLSEIGSSCGFHSSSYFGKVFREATGFTPQSYRLGTYLKKS